MAVNTLVQAVASDTAAKYGAIYGVNKASFQDKTNAQTNALTLAQFIA